jgi:hypothetical protein
MKYQPAAFTAVCSVSKSPTQVARVAYLTAREALEPFACAQSKHTFTQPQLLAILILKTFFQTDYRGIVALLSEWSDLRLELELKRVPHYSTLCYAEKRLLKKVLRSAAKNSSLLGFALGRAGLESRIST